MLISSELRHEVELNSKSKDDVFKEIRRSMNSKVVLKAVENAINRYGDEDVVVPRALDARVK
eukprot:1769-Karenia_brevis.AAC.1